VDQPIRIFIISDYKLFIEGLTDLVYARGEFVITGAAANLEDARGLLAQAGPRSFDVILLDATMKREEAVQIAREIKQDMPDIRLIVLGLEHHEESIVEFIEAGAVGYVLKDASLDELFNTVAAIHSGQSPCSARVAASVFNRIVQLSRKQRLIQTYQQANLTAREKDILSLMSAGLCNREIAKHLNIALYTVKNHVHNILEKLQVHSRKEAVSYAFEKGLLNEGGAHAFVHQNLQLDGGAGSF
jgi:two-component system nitrate/nitrite response regulator NarL